MKVDNYIDEDLILIRQNVDHEVLTIALPLSWGFAYAQSLVITHPDDVYRVFGEGVDVTLQFRHSENVPR